LKHTRKGCLLNFLQTQQLLCINHHADLHKLELWVPPWNSVEYIGRA
jgi:hypothetical protein